MEEEVGMKVIDVLEEEEVVVHMVADVVGGEVGGGVGGGEGGGGLYGSRCGGW